MQDCKRVGVKPGPIHHNPGLPLFDWGKVPILTQPAEKIDPVDADQDCFYNDDDLKTLDIRVANLGYYHGVSFDRLDSQKLLDDIKAVSLS